MVLKTYWIAWWYILLDVLFPHPLLKKYRKLVQYCGFDIGPMPYTYIKKA